MFRVCITVKLNHLKRNLYCMSLKVKGCSVKGLDVINFSLVVWLDASQWIEQTSRRNGGRRSLKFLLSVLAAVTHAIKKLRRLLYRFFLRFGITREIKPYFLSFLSRKPSCSLPQALLFKRTFLFYSR